MNTVFYYKYRVNFEYYIERRLYVNTVQLRIKTLILV